MEVVLRKYGNSTVVVLPPMILKDLGLVADQKMTLNTTKEGKITLERKLKYSLAEMLAQCDFDTLPPSDLELWDKAKPVGQEIW